MKFKIVLTARLGKIVFEIATLAFLTLFSQDLAFGETNTTVNNAFSTQKSDVDNVPDKLLAFQTLYKTKRPVDSQKIDTNHFSKIWFSIRFNDENNNYYTMFTQVQELDEQGEPSSCHACTVTIDAITYIYTPNGWDVDAIEKNISTAGSWGRAPEIKSAKILTLARGNLIIAIPTSYAGQGITSQSEMLLNHFRRRWNNVGYIDLAEDNSGSNCINRGEKNRKNYSSDCYAFKSTYSLQRGNNATYPDIVVTRKGTQYSGELGTVVPAQNEKYFFDGKKYTTQREQALENSSAAGGQAVTPNVSQSAQIIRADLSQLLNDYRENELNADNKYKGKLILTSGFVKEVKKDILGHPYVILGTNTQYELPRFQASFDDAKTSLLAQLKKDQFITVACQIRGLLFNVQADNCALN